MLIRATILTALLSVSLYGCKPAQPIVPDSLLPEATANDAPLPSYTELVQEYNGTTAALSPIWAKARVDLAWREEDGDRKNEHGTGRFMYVRPGKIVLEVREFGRGFWAGADGVRYWFFELRDKKTAYVGRFDRIDDLSRDTMPLLVNPADLLYVMGLKKIDPDKVPAEPAVERVKGYYLIEPPGLGLRMLLDPLDGRPVRVDLLDDQGQSRVVCNLSDPIAIEHGQSGDPLAHRIASVVDVYMPGTEARMTVTLSNTTHNTRNIRDQHFDFDLLSQALKPDEVVELDQPRK